jgi:hypothetical protein
MRESDGGASWGRRDVDNAERRPDSGAGGLTTEVGRFPIACLATEGTQGIDLHLRHVGRVKAHEKRHKD